MVYISDTVTKIGDNCFIGANVTLMGNVTVGRGSLIGVNTFIRNMNIPPFSVVVGSENPRIIKRFSFVNNEWKEIETWTEDDENAILSEKLYRELLYKSLQEKFTNTVPLPLKAVGKSNGDLFL